MQLPSVTLVLALTLALHSHRRPHCRNRDTRQVSRIKKEMDPQDRLVNGRREPHRSRRLGSHSKENEFAQHQLHNHVRLFLFSYLSSLSLGS